MGEGHGQFDLGLSERPLHVRDKGTETHSGVFWAVITLLSSLGQCHKSGPGSNRNKLSNDLIVGGFVNSDRKLGQ